MQLTAEGFFYWGGQEVEGEAAEDDAHANALAQGDAFIENEPSEDAGTDGFAKDAHGDGGGGDPFEEQVEDELPHDGGDHSETEKTGPGLATEAGEGLMQRQGIEGEEEGTATEGEHRVYSGRGVLTNNLPDE